MPAPPDPRPSADPGLRGPLLVLGGAVLWGTTGTAQALGPATSTPIAVGAVRLVAGAALLVLWALVASRRTGGRVRDPSAGVIAGAAGHLPPGTATRHPHGRRTLGTALVGGVAVAAYQVAFFAAVDLAGVALGTAVAIGSAPVVTGLIEWATAGRRPTPRWWAATCAAAAGVAVLAGPSSIVPAGVALALAAGASYAIYAVASKHLLDTGMPSSRAMAMVFGTGGLLLLPVLAVVDLSWVAEPAGMAVVAWLAGGTILLSYLLFGAGLRLVPAATAATLSLAEPLTAALLGVAVLGERPTPAGIAGGALVLVGLLVLTVRLPARQVVAGPR